MYNRHSRVLALILALTMTVSMVPIHNVKASEQTQETAEEERDAGTNEEEEELKYERIDIGTPEEFADFASKCYIDAWSKNKYVSLKADIDLSGTEIKVIPVFNGVFDGVGHTISGFDYLGDGYIVGLFRYVESDGIIQNLILKGNIESENEKECIGSLVGINHGTIKNCTFQGTVSGRDTVGGIAGINESTGTISGCDVKGRITGYYSTGGIVGVNHGALNYCTNRAGINDDSAWVEQDDEMGTGMGILESLTANDDNELYSGVDTGGIAGFSDGVISRCTNSGTVGYEHTGYNIGGIVGRQSGVVSLSTNSGVVYGRKDIGGIVGQMEPFIEVDEAESLRNAINKLHDIIDKTIDDMDATSDGLKGDVDRMQSYADSAIDSGDALVTQFTDFVDENVDEVNSVSERMEHIIDLLPDILNNVSAAGDSMSDLNNVAKQLSDDLAILDKLDDSSYNETDYNRISLLSTVGGTLTADSTNPEEKDTVTVTVAPNDGYKLKDGSLTVTDAGGKKISVNSVSGRSDQYTFTMPKKNVKVTAQFVYKGTFLVKSTVGGRITTKEDDDKVTFKASSSSGYKFDSYNVNGSKYTGAVTEDNEITLDRNAYVKDDTSVVVEAVFTKVSAASHRVRVKSGTGGTAYVSGGSNTAAAGEEVTIHIVANADYVYKEMFITGDITSTPSSANVNERVFKMPDNDVDVEVLFQSKYDQDSRNRIYAESNVGGSIVVRKGVSGSEYQITIRPDEDYDLDENRALEFRKVTLSGTAGTEIQEESSMQEEGSVVQEPDFEEVPTIEQPSIEENTEIIESTSSEENTSSQENSTSEESVSESETTSAEESKSENETLSTEESESESETLSTEESESESETLSTEESELESETLSTEESESESETLSTEKSESESDSSFLEDIFEKETNIENTNPLSVSVLGKNDLTYNSDTDTYTYIVDLNGDNDSYSAYATFVKKQDSSSSTGDSHNITTASSTGGVVAVDTTSAEAGDKVYATPTASDGYVLTSILVNGEKPSLESDGKRYSFAMPDKDVEVTAQFEPVDIILRSNMSGNATYAGNAEGKVTVNVVPSSAYTVDSISVADASGKKLSVSKRQSGSYVYEFDITKMSKAPCTVDIKFKKQNKKQAVDTSKTNIQDSIDELSKESNDVQKSINKIKDIVQKADGSYKGWDELTSAEQDTIVTEVINLVDYLGNMSSSASSILSSLTTVYNILNPYVTEAADAAKKDIDRATDYIHDMLDSLKAANNGVKGIVNYMNAQPDIRFSKLGDDFDIAKENFHDQLKGLSDSIKALSDNAVGYSDIINNDLRAVNDQLNVVFNLLADRMVDIEHLSIEELYEDVDDENIDSITTGRADICTNKGIVKGDINVGGIAGSMSIDDEDPEDSAAGSIEYEIGRRFITKCLVTSSVNEGYITAKKNGAGGICGYMNHGIIVNSESYGSVESTEGDYVGGICGESLTIIKHCYALCSVMGNKNVGGIAGYGETIKNCYSMVDVQAENGRAGAIAGQISSYEEVDTDAEESAKVVENYYVGDDTYGIDNISYIGVAEPISYQELLTVEQLPTQFWHLKAIYKIEDTYLGSEEVKYGERLDKLNFPQIPAKEGFYGVWPDVSDKVMVGTFVVEAEYKDNVTVVQSNHDTDDTETGQWQKPYALVEDIFTEDTVLHVQISEMTPPEQADGKQNVVYEVILENGGIKDLDSFSLRILNPYEDASVYGYKDGAWTELESKTRGQYLQVSMAGSQEYFCVVENKSNLLVMIICTAAGAVVLIGLIVGIKKRKALRKQRRQANKPNE